MSRGFASNYRIVLLAAGLFVGFGGLGARLVWLHVIARDQLLRTVAKVRRQLIVEKARRGDILDANNAIIATSRSLMVLGVDPSSLRKEDEKKWPQLAALIGVPETELRKIFTTKFRAPAPANPASAASSAAPAGLVFNFNLTAPAPKHDALPADATSELDDADDPELDPADDANGRREIKWAKLAENISESTYTAVEKLGIKGVYGNRVYRRAYPHHELGAHVVGYVDRTQQPATGIERYTDFYLRGQDGWRVGERDGRNRELAQFNARDVPRADGYAVKLSLDLNVQDIVEQELARIVQEYQPLKATIIVSDAHDGFILGMGNWPTFDPNEFNKVPKDEMERLKNVAVADVYEPGSVFKIVAASAALEEHLVTPGTMFNCALSRIDYKGRTLNLPPDDHAFENPQAVPVSRIVSFSSNRGAAQLGMALGEERLYRYARAFGFGRTLGFPIGGEVPGLFARPEKWNPIDITRIPMGQSVAVTVLQMHEAMSTIASDGVRLRPQIIREIRDAAGETVYSFAGVAEERVISTQTARTMARLLTGVASKDGTAPEAAIRIGGTDYEVAGKTGTTQKLEPVTLASGRTELRYSHQHHVASFVGFFPASHPQVVISVIVDDADARAPGGTAYGKTVAAPSFKRIGEQLISYLKIGAGRTLVAPNFFAMEGGRR